MLSGQGRLDARSWGNRLALVSEVPLEVFTDEEARALSALRSVADERVVEAVLRLSGRLPVLVHTLAQARPGSGRTVGNPSRTAVKRFPERETHPARRAAAPALALPLQSDEDVHRAVAPPEAAEQYAWASRLACVTHQAGRCRCHEVVRTPLLRLQHLQSPTRWRPAHELPAEAFRTWRTGREKSLPAAEHWNDAAWREHRYNKTCRRVCAGPCHALPDALTQTVHACGHGSATARGWTPLLAQAGTDTEDDDLQARAERLTGACRNGTAAVRRPRTLLAHFRLGHRGPAACPNRARATVPACRAERGSARLPDRGPRPGPAARRRPGAGRPHLPAEQTGNATAVLAEQRSLTRTRQSAFFPPRCWNTPSKLGMWTMHQKGSRANKFGVWIMHQRGAGAARSSPPADSPRSPRWIWSGRERLGSGRIRGCPLPCTNRM